MLAICLTACVVDDLTLVFGFLSGVAECLITFILPSVFWFISLKIEKEQSHPKTKTKSVAIWEKAVVGLFLAFGVAYFMVSNYYNVVKILRAT